MTRPTCIDCRFFDPESMVPDDSPADLVEGECRRHPPVVGVMITDRHGDESRHLGEWPRVLGCFWCGAFEPHPTNQGAKPDDVSVGSPTLAHVAAHG